MDKLLHDLYRFEDTCNVYVIRDQKAAVLIDFGSGNVLDHLAEIGVNRVAAVLMTHHHRDQAQGLARAVAAGIPVWVPHTEQDLFRAVDAHWQAREVFNNYRMRQDRFSLLEPVSIAGTLQDYAVQVFDGLSFSVLPTPGHTTGSITLLAEINQKRVAFSGDLIAAPGQMWSLAATQWAYNEAEGVAASIPSLLDLKDCAPDLLLPSHGAPMTDPGPAIDLLVERLWSLLRLRGSHPRLFELHARPYEPVTPHVLRHRVCEANTYVLLSESRKALLIDFGYDFATSEPSGSDRASRRPWLHTLPALKAQFGIQRIEVALPTHYHDDHVAGFNLLREVEDTSVWAAESFADVLENPTHYDIPCLWYDPIPVNRRLPLGVPIPWEEYTLTLHPLPGHTLYAVAIEFEADGKRFLATGDQYMGDEGVEPNYVYPNRFRVGDYTLSAALYRRIAPDVILSGHWLPLWIKPGYFDRLDRAGAELDRLHRDLQPAEPDLGAEGFLARLSPYQVLARGGEPVEFAAEVRNPFPRPAEATLAVVAPAGWSVSGPINLALPASATATARFQVTPPAGFAERRARIAVDVTIDGRRFGQQAEALLSADYVN